MKRNTSLSVTEFHQLVASMLEQADAELRAAKARMEALRSTTMPPG
jgi:hypothetical protein